MISQKIISIEQLRAARAWLNISQDEVATLASVGRRAVADFERGTRMPHDRTLNHLQAALEQQGIEFLFNGHKGVGIRLKTND